jgi:hypothetical protein
VSPRRLFEDANAEDVPKIRKTRLEFRKTVAGNVPFLVTFVENLVVLASITNLAKVLYKIGYKAVSLGGDCAKRWVFPLWAF